MTRSYRSPRTRQSRITQPIRIVRPRDPSITPLGFTCYRLVRVHDGNVPFVAIPHVERTNTMSVFAR